MKPTIHCLSFDTFIKMASNCECTRTSFKYVRVIMCYRALSCVVMSKRNKCSHRKVIFIKVRLGSTAMTCNQKSRPLLSAEMHDSSVQHFTFWIWIRRETLEWQTPESRGEMKYMFNHSCEQCTEAKKKRHLIEVVSFTCVWQKCGHFMCFS